MNSVSRPNPPPRRPPRRRARPRRLRLHHRRGHRGAAPGRRRDADGHRFGELRHDLDRRVEHPADLAEERERSRGQRQRSRLRRGRPGRLRDRRQQLRRLHRAGHDLHADRALRPRRRRPPRSEPAGSPPTGTPAEYFTELSGEGAAPELTFEPGGHDFGLVEAHSNSPRTNFTLRNSGTASAQLALGNLEISGPDANEFFIPNSNCWGRTLAPGATCQVEVQFNANEEGSFAAAVSIRAGNVGFTAPLAGRAERPKVEASPTPLVFGRPRSAPRRPGK